ncbi:predicted protein [Postia placenta Mad-698-R]|nr:predicted protein [Postia placenta Mad-698-R]
MFWLRMRPRLNGLHTGGLVLFGLWSATYALTSRLHLDSDEETERKARLGTVRSTQASALAKEKSLDQFSLARNELHTALRNDDSNNPIEDDHAEAILPVPSGFWSFFAVLDGHSGWETSAWLRENLIPATSGALADIYQAHRPPAPSDALPLPASVEIDQSIKDTFKRLDDDIVHRAVEQVFAAGTRTAAARLLAPAYAGSCALLAFYDSHTRVLRAALAGDSRAVLGRRTVDARGRPAYAVHVLTVEQDGHNPAEEYRLNAQHPGEAVVVNGRVLGMGPSRAFGDALFKWTRDVQWKLKQSFLGRTPRANVKTPPYLTAEPEVTSFEVEPGDFLILATDGLWECLSSREAVGLVGLWLESQKGPLPQSDTSSVMPKDLPVLIEDDEDAPVEESTVRHRQWGAEKRFANADGNAATHLLRNALGGADQDLTAAILSLRSPRSRTFIDDITAVVVFFGDNPGPLSKD